MLIARLIADTDQLQANMDAACEALARAGQKVAEVHLNDFAGRLAHFSIVGDDAAGVRSILDRHFSPSDLLVTAAELGRVDLFVSDMDSTMIGQECIDELADFAGLKPQVAAITERAMRGELDFESALRERVGLLAGLEESAITRCLDERIRPTPGARNLVEQLKKRGARCVLVTGGFHHFADPVAEMLGFDRVVGNRLAVKDGKLTGDLEGPISNSATKERALGEEAARIGNDPFVLAMGDGANDIPMLQAATFGLAFEAKPKAREVADGWLDRGAVDTALDLLAISTHR